MSIKTPLMITNLNHVYFDKMPHCRIQEVILGKRDEDFTYFYVESQVPIP
jgi:hypothetical protein